MNTNNICALPIIYLKEINNKLGVLVEQKRDKLIQNRFYYLEYNLFYRVAH